MGTDTEGETRASRKLGHHIHEEWGDLFSAPLSTSLAHCVSSDMKMGAGIAVRFRQKFGHIEDLLRQGKTTGEVAFLQEGPRFIFYLVTKDRFFNKPTENTLRSSLLEMKTLCRNFGVKKLAMPRVGCGLDGLQWSSVLKMINEVFWNGGIHITIYSICHSIDQMSSPAVNYDRKFSGRYSHSSFVQPLGINSSPSRSEPSKKRHSSAHLQHQGGESSPKNYYWDGSPKQNKRKYSKETKRIDYPRLESTVGNYSRDRDGSPELKKPKYSKEKLEKDIGESLDKFTRPMLKAEAHDLWVKLTRDDSSSSKTVSQENRRVPKRSKRVDESPVDCLSETEVSPSETSSPIRHVDVSDSISVKFYASSKKNKERSICHSDIECKASKTISPRMEPVNQNRSKEEMLDNRQCSRRTSYQDLCSSSKRKRNEDEDMSEEVGSREEYEGVTKVKKGKKKKRPKEDKVVEHERKSKNKKQEFTNEAERIKVMKNFEKRAIKWERLHAEDEAKMQAIKKAHVDKDEKEPKAKKGMKEEDGRKTKKKEKKKSKSNKSERKSRSTKKRSKCERGKDEKKSRRKSEQNTKEKFEKEVKLEKNESLKVMLNEIYKQVEVENMKGALNDSIKMKSLKNEDDDLNNVKKRFTWKETNKTINNHYSQLNVLNCVESNVSVWEDSE